MNLKVNLVFPLGLLCLWSVNSEWVLIWFKDWLFFIKSHAELPTHWSLKSALFLDLVFINLVQLHQFREVFSFLKFLVTSLSLNFTMLHHDNMISLVQKVNGVGYKNTRSVLQNSKVDISYYLLTDMCIKSRNRIVHKIDIFVGIYSSCEAKSSFLSTTKVNSFFSNHSLITFLERFEIRF